MARRGRYLRRRLAERISVITLSGETVIGWLEDAGPDGVLIRVPEIHTDGDVPARPGGELFIPDSNIKLIQLGESVRGDR